METTKKTAVTAQKQVTEVTLELGQVMLASLKGTKNANKGMLEFVEAKERVGQAVNLTNLLNEGDERFANSVSLRRHYQTGEYTALKKQFGITDAQITEAQAGKVVELKVLNPTLDINGKKTRVVIQHNDSFKPAVNEGAPDIRTQAKKNVNKTTGDETFFTREGKLIFQVSSLTLEGQRKDSIIEKDAPLMSWDEYEMLSVVKVDPSQGLNS